MAGGWGVRLTRCGGRPPVLASDSDEDPARVGLGGRGTADDPPESRPRSQSPSAHPRPHRRLTRTPQWVSPTFLSPWRAEFRLSKGRATRNEEEPRVFKDAKIAIVRNQRNTVVETRLCDQRVGDLALSPLRQDAGSEKARSSPELAVDLQQRKSRDRLDRLPLQRRFTENLRQYDRRQRELPRLERERDLLDVPCRSSFEESTKGARIDRDHSRSSLI